MSKFIATLFYVFIASVVAIFVMFRIVGKAGAQLNVITVDNTP